MNRMYELKNEPHVRSRSPSPSEPPGTKRMRTVSMEDIRNMRVLAGPSSPHPGLNPSCPNPGFNPGFNQEVEFGLGEADDEMWRVNLELESESHVFEAGESVIGHAVLQLETPLRVKSVQVVLQGEGHTSTSLKVGVRRKTTLCTAHEEYYRKQLQLVGSRDGLVTLDVGVHVLPFMFVLPDRLPTSLDSQMGSVAYKISALVDTDCPSPSIESQTAAVLRFAVTARTDLNSLPSSRQPVALKASKQLLLPRRGKVKVDAVLGRQGLSPGELIPLQGEVSARGVPVHVSLSLRQSVRYLFREPEGGEHHSTVSEEVASVQYPRQLSDSKLELASLRLQVPALAPSTLPGHGGRLIHVSYSLLLEMRNTRGDTLLKLNTPLILGSVPLHLRSQLADSLYRYADAAADELVMLDAVSWSSGRSTPTSSCQGATPTSFCQGATPTSFCQGRSTPTSFCQGRSTPTSLCAPVEQHASSQPKDVGFNGPAIYFPSSDLDDPICL